MIAAKIEKRTQLREKVLNLTSLNQKVSTAIILKKVRTKSKSSQEVLIKIISHKARNLSIEICRRKLRDICQAQLVKFKAEMKEKGLISL
jgi:hypothetical protein